MSLLFDEGDRQRLERENALTEQLPRQSIVEDRSPSESILTSATREANEFSGDTMRDPVEMMLDGLMEVLRSRL